PGEPGAGAAPARLTAQATTTEGDVRHVTLITGDRLMVPNDGQVIIEPDPARASIRFANFTSRGQHYVVPSDALPALTAGELDYQLFSVTELLGSGFPAGTLPLVVTYAAGGEQATRSSLAAGGATVTRQLPSVDSLAASAAEKTVATLWTQLTTAVTQGRRLKSTIDKVWLDQVRRTSLDESVAQVGAPAAHAAGYDGSGVTVAVLDSGIDGNHPDLVGKVVAEQNFTSEPDAADRYGHGTHVASTVAGTGTASQGRNRGVAPGARLLNGKVCTGDGSCTMSAIIDGMEWAAAQDADVVNMSLGGPDGPGIDPLEQAVDELTASTGTLFVVAAGNIPATETLASPGTADAALTVGAVDGADNLASFSHRGPRPDDAGLKPDMTAPGVNITAARAGSQGYVDASGTSMATPHVAGAAAILHQRRPTWSPAQLKAALVGSTRPNAALGAYEQGTGRLDVARAYQQTVMAEPASLSLGRQAYPHADDPILNRTVTYSNQGTGAVTLSLALRTRAPSGAAAPAGMFALNATSVTVPAGGSASVTLTTNTRVAAPDGLYTGAISATAAGISVQTAFGVDRAIEAYDLTLDVISRQGFSTPAHSTLVQSADGNNFWLVGGPGPITIPRLPRGSYLVTSQVFDGGPQGQETTVLAAPRVELTQNRSIVMDARLARPVAIAVPDPQAALFSTEVGIQLTGSGEGAWSNGYVSNGATFTGQIGNQNVWGTVSKIGATLAQRGPGNNFYNSPRVYHLGWFTEQRLPTGWSRTVAPADLATVQATYAGHIPGGYAAKAAFSHPGGTLFGSYVAGAIGIGLDFDVPFQRTELYNTDGDVRWHAVMAERDGQIGIPNNHLVSSVTRYTGGSTVQETWNRPVYGPAFTSSIYKQHWVVRRGNTITADVPLTGDGDGHAGLPHPDRATGTLVLRRNGTVIGETAFPSRSGVPQFTVPAGNAQYRLDATIDRTEPLLLSTRVSAAWTFNSDTVDANSYLRLPLWAVSFTPPTDLRGTAPAGRSFTIPLRAHVQPDAASAGLRTLTVDYSLNDGGSWQPAALTTAPDGTGTATVTHPGGHGFVSLRARVVDWAGNAVDQTVLRAYRIAPA
ncbi:MAG TPA: S8 family serine peptidase, partial [Pilimelia sp.]|nr:S8 family serine peptidase [Pilimelia sp.]